MIEFFIPIAISTITGIIGIVTKNDITKKYILYAISIIMIVCSIGILIYINGIVSAYENIIDNVDKSLSYNHNPYRGLASKVYFSKDSIEISNYWKSANDTATLRALEKEFVEQFVGNTEITLRETQNQIRLFSITILGYAFILSVIKIADNYIVRKRGSEFSTDNTNKKED